VRVVFCRSNAIGSKIIRALTWSEWSHVAILLDDDTVVEATWPKVRHVPLATLLASHTEYAIVRYHGGVSVADAALSQVGKPYDVLALFGFLVHRNWQSTGKWFCSELVAWAFNEGKYPLFNSDNIFRVTPQNIWMLFGKIVRRATNIQK